MLPLAESGASIRMLVRRWIIFLAVLATACFLLFLSVRNTAKEVNTARSRVVASMDRKETPDLEVPVEASNDPRSLPQQAELQAPSTEAEPGLRPIPEPLAIAGVVLLPDRSPAAAARVVFAKKEAVTDEQGSFRLPLVGSSPEMILAAGLEGYGPAILPRFGEVVAAASPHAPPPATLVLGAHPLSIAGVVVDEANSPLPGWIVSVIDATQLSQPLVPIHKDGKRVVQFSTPRSRIRYAESLGGNLESDTDYGGAFRIQGLLNRNYVLRALDPRTLVFFETAPLPAGDEDVRILIPSDLAFARVAGVVVSRKGAPVPYARVQLVTQQSGGTRQVLTDERGAFEFLEVPRRGTFIHVLAKSFMPAKVALSSDLDATGIAIEVAARCDFRIQFTGGEGLYAEVLDAAGQPLTIHCFKGSVSSSFNRLSFGSSIGGVRTFSADRVFSVAEEASIFRIVEGSTEMREIHRQPIALVPGKVTEIRVDF